LRQEWKKLEPKRQVLRKLARLMPSRWKLVRKKLVPKLELTRQGPTKHEKMLVSSRLVLTRLVLTLVHLMRGWILLKKLAHLMQGLKRQEPTKQELRKPAHLKHEKVSLRQVPTRLAHWKLEPKMLVHWMHGLMLPRKLVLRKLEPMKQEPK
jgi:hypothetical protein